jgi:hypothetical protein
VPARIIPFGRRPHHELAFVAVLGILGRLSELAKEDPKRQFFSIAHLITAEKMYAALLNLRKDASAGVDGVTYEEYEKDATRNIRELRQRLKDGKYRAQPLGRVYIPRKRETEADLVQKGMVEILNAIYELGFLDCTCGFRPGRGAHPALARPGVGRPVAPECQRLRLPRRLYRRLPVDGARACTRGNSRPDLLDTTIIRPAILSWRGGCHSVGRTMCELFASILSLTLPVFGSIASFAYLCSFPCRRCLL